MLGSQSGSSCIKFVFIEINKEDSRKWFKDNKTAKQLANMHHDLKKPRSINKIIKNRTRHRGQTN